MAGCEPEWIREVSGIEERRWAAEDETVAGMAARAAEACLGAVAARELGLILVASGSAERRFPGPAAEVAHRLGLDRTPAIDLPLASAGSIVALDLARRLAADYGAVLAIGAEKMSAVIRRAPIDRSTAILFGDGAGACLVTASREGAVARVVDSAVASDGAYAEDLRLGLEGAIEMNGRAVILQASRKIPRAIASLLEANATAPGDVAAFLMHQANRNLMVRVAASLSVPPERFFSNIERYGNTSSASLLIAAAEFFERRPPAQSPVVFAAFGAGFHWGALLAVSE